MHPKLQVPPKLYVCPFYCPQIRKNVIYQAAIKNRSVSGHPTEPKKAQQAVGILFFLGFYFAPKRHSVGIIFIFFINFRVHILSYQFQMLPSRCFHFFTFVNFHVRICTLLNPKLPTLTIKFHYERVHEGFITFITAL